MPSGNVLFITLDQIRADALNGPLAAFVPTPNFDRLMRDGVTFENHFTVTVPCGPARASLLTGLYAMNHRSVRNGAPLAAHHATIGTEARKAGYEPLLFGYTDIPPEPAGKDPSDPDLSSYEGIAQGFREITEMRLESGREWPAYLLSKGYRLDIPDGSRKVPDLFRPVAADGANRPAINDPALYRSEDSDTAYLADRVITQMSARIDRPWFAHVTFIRPHPPLVAPEPFNRMVDPVTLPPASQKVPPHPFVDAWFAEPSNHGLFWDFDGNCAGLSASQTAACRAVYLGLIAEVDFHLGRILDWLEETGQRENTLVVVTGDHGEMLGDQRMWGKDSVFEPAWHVPLVIRDPRFGIQAGKRVTALTESIDVAPTILEFMGRQPPPAMDGMALTPFLAGGAPAWRAGVFGEIDLASPVRPTRFQSMWNLGVNACNAAIWREKRWKYVHFNGGIEPMLFDLENDPDETVNLASDKAQAGEIARMRAAMLDRRMERADRRLTGLSIGI